MKALVIAPQPFFSFRGTPFSVYYRTLVLAEEGLQIDLLTYGQGEDVDLPGVRIIRIPRFAFLGPVKIGPSPLKLFLDAFLIVWTVALLLRHRYAFVHAHEEAVFFCRALKPIFRFRLVYDMHSSLPQQLTNFGFSRSRLLIGIFSWLEKSCLRTADAVITICPDLARYVTSLLGPTQRHVLIENSIFEPVRLRRAQHRTTAVSLPEGAPLLLYAGTFEPYQGIDLLIRAMAEVRRKLPQAHLVLAGGTDAQVVAMRSAASAAGVADACTFLGPVPQQVVGQLFDAADLVVSPRTRGTNTPLKIYEILSRGVPLIATQIESHTQILDDDVCFLVEPTAESMARGVLTAWADPELRRRLAREAQALYEAEYSRTAYVSKLRQVLRVLGLATTPVVPSPTAAPASVGEAETAWQATR